MKRKHSQFFCLYGEEGARFLPSHFMFSFSSSLPSSFSSWVAWCTAKGLMNICFVPDTVSGALEKLLFNTPNNSQIMILPLVFEGGNRSWKKSGKLHELCIPAVKTSLQLGRSDSNICILPAINVLIFFLLKWSARKLWAEVLMENFPEVKPMILRLCDQKIDLVDKTAW